MTNIVDTLIARIEKRRTENKNACKNYATKVAAEKATAVAAQNVANEFHRGTGTAKSARYVVFYVPSWGRWCGGIDMTEVMNRDTSTGGYVGVEIGFYKY